jgi:hypothetical protein
MKYDVTGVARCDMIRPNIQCHNSWKNYRRRIFHPGKPPSNIIQELKQLSKQLLLAKKNAHESVKVNTKNEGKCWMECYKYVKICKGKTGYNAAIEDGNGWVITDWTEKSNSLNLYYS